jgi:hypothetical protein
MWRSGIAATAASPPSTIAKYVASLACVYGVEALALARDRIRELIREVAPEPKRGKRIRAVKPE